MMYYIMVCTLLALIALHAVVKKRWSAILAFVWACAVMWYGLALIAVMALEAM